MFEPLALATADAVEVGPGEAALDVACGTGVLTRVLAERVGSDGRVVGLDLSEGDACRRSRSRLDRRAHRLRAGTRRAAALRGGRVRRRHLPAGLAVRPRSSRCAGRVQARARPRRQARRRLLGGDRPPGQLRRDRTLRWIATSGPTSATSSGCRFGCPTPPSCGRCWSRPDSATSSSRSSGWPLGSRIPPTWRRSRIGSSPVAAAFAAGSDQQRAAVTAEVACELEAHREGDTIAFEMPSLIAVALA